MSLTMLAQRLGDQVRIRTGKLDANASAPDGAYPFFTCSEEPLRIATFSYDCECVLVAGNGDLNVKYYDGKFDAYQRTYIIESADKLKLDVRYLFHFMSVYVERLRRMSIGGVIKYIKLGYLTEAKIPMPTLAEQRRIAEVLDRAEALRVKRRAALTQIDILNQSFFIDLFGRPKENPKGWPLVPLMEICSPKQWPTISTTQLTDTGFPVFGANGLIGCFSEFNHEEPTVLITCRGATCGTINVSPQKCYVTGNAMALDNPDSERITIEYLETVLRMRDMTDTISGTAQPQITRQNLLPVELPLPPLPLQREFARRVRAVEKLKTAQRASLAELDALFATLQHRAFKGELFSEKEHKSLVA